MDDVHNEFLYISGNSLDTNMNFTTADRQNDGRPQSGNCANLRGGPWWYLHGCGYSDLNGEYVNGGKSISSGTGLFWSSWKPYSYSMKITKMMTGRNETI